MNKKTIAVLLAAGTIFNCFSGIIAFAKDNAIEIRNAEDFKALAKRCTLDSASEKMTVKLMRDIDFSDGEFAPIPIFNGVFNGNGYTLSGISCKDKGSYKGVFRYVGQSGIVSDLNVEGDFVPNGSKSFVGGIAGENSGLIERCSFDGKVDGENVIGGIAGSNTDGGKILSCTATGSVTGENSTGGIVGKNSGYIQNCVNSSAVNTIYKEKKSSISDMDTDGGSIVENYKKSEEENKEESVLGHTDTGGIAGFTSGTIKGCVNNAEVGYKHIGYNVGGIAGRQSGYILGCENYGLVRGRKDVGGIVGQAEPYVLLDASEGMLGDLKSELDRLNTLVNKFITDADELGDDAKKYSDEISDNSKSARAHARDLLDRISSFTDDNVSEINAEAAILSNNLDKLSPAVEDLETGFGDLKNALDKLSVAFDDIKLYAPELGDEIDDVNSALEKLSSAEEYLMGAVAKFNRAKNDLDEAVEFKNTEKVKLALEKISDSIKSLITAKKKIRAALGEIEDVLTSNPEDFESVGVNAKKILENLKIVKENNEIAIKSLERINDGIGTIVLNTEIDFSEFKSAASRIDMAIGYLTAAIHDANEGLSELGYAARDIYDVLKPYADDTSEDFNSAKDNLSEAFKLLSYAAEDIEKSVGKIKDIISEQANEAPPEFVKLGDDFKNSSELLFDSVSGISNGLEGLKDTFSAQKGKISGDLTAVANCFNSVMHIMADEIDGLDDINVSDIFVDVSDEATESVKQGKTEDCRNFGAVEADRNAGGIAGAVAKEYAKDPEDDIEKPNALNFTYRSKAVIQSCVNDGKITGKKDCTGGIAGFEEIGTIYKCENYGDVEAPAGNYVGGIAGKSEASIRKSLSKSKISGKRYVGGAVGKCERLTACRVIANVCGEENVGAICGDTQNKENVYRNFFVDNGLGGIDGISYKEKAEPIDYEALKNTAGIPERFISFSASFSADGRIIETDEIIYGDDTAKIKYPEIPEKKGYFGTWIKPEEETVTENIVIECEYKPYVTLLASEEKNETGKLALALCEGEFTDKARLYCTDSSENYSVRDAENAKVYDISLKNTDIEDGDPVTLRILNENKDKITVRILSDDGERQKTKVSSRGKYVVFTANGPECTIYVKYEKKGFNIVLPLALAAALSSVAVLAVRYRRKKAK